MLFENPMGIDGIEFIEFKVNPYFTEQIENLGFHSSAEHFLQNVIVYQQHDIRLLVNLDKSPWGIPATQSKHSLVSSIGINVRDAKSAYEMALKAGAKAAENVPTIMPDVPAILGFGGLIIYFIERKNQKTNYSKYFSPLPIPIKSSSCGLINIDYINMVCPSFEECVPFYKQVFNFREMHDEYEVTETYKRKSLLSPCENFRIVFHEVAHQETKSVTHIAFTSADIYSSVNLLKHHNVNFIETSSKIYETSAISASNDTAELSQPNPIFIYGSKDKTVLQAYIISADEEISFEIIQRK